jgi:hypothetical protein
VAAAVTSAYPHALFHADPTTYVPHPLHGDNRTYRETNCWTDVLIELLHAGGHEPLAAMGAALRVDFEGDQWTFLKPSGDTLERLYGLDVHEMQPYRPLPLQAAEQLDAGRTLIVELDAFHLPDTAATAYGREHVKTSVAIEAIDVAGQRLRYFHNAGLHELEGDDFRGAFRLDGPADPEVLPPYTELVRFDAAAVTRDASALRSLAGELLPAHLLRRPTTNPFERFGVRLQDDLPGLLSGDDEAYHSYAFATVRMAGSSFELAAAHVRWLLGAQTPALEALDAIVADCKLLSFKLARRRTFDPLPVVARMATAWEHAMGDLDDRAR